MVSSGLSLGPAKWQIFCSVAVSTSEVFSCSVHRTMEVLIGKLVVRQVGTMARSSIGRRRSVDRPRRYRLASIDRALRLGVVCLRLRSICLRSICLRSSWSGIRLLRQLLLLRLLRLLRGGRQQTSGVQRVQDLGHNVLF